MVFYVINKVRNKSTFVGILPNEVVNMLQFKECTFAR